MFYIKQIKTLKLLEYYSNLLLILPKNAYKQNYKK